MNYALAFNVGSSSKKISLMDASTMQSKFQMHFKKIDEDEFSLSIGEKTRAISSAEFANPAELIFSSIEQMGIQLTSIEFAGHRIVHGGDEFTEPIELTAPVVEKIKKYNEFAPLHNPPALEVLNGVLDYQSKIQLDLKHFGVFDTAFHTTVPSENYLYAIPYGYFENLKVRRYGFHGLAYASVANQLKEIDLQLVNSAILCHLGSGSSVCAVKNGKSLNHSFGFTPTENLIMATRSGEVDYDAIKFLKNKMNLSDNDVDTLLNKESGLLGLSGYTSDMKQLLEDMSTNPRAELAVKMYVAKIVEYIAKFFVELGGCSCLAFSGGVGAGSDVIRKMIVERLKSLGIVIDDSKNANQINVSKVLQLASADSTCDIYVIPANEEEYMIKELS